MKQTILKKLMVGLLIVSSISCVDNQRDLTDGIRSLRKDQYFDFNINQTVALNIDYCFNGTKEHTKDYRILFEIYDQQPFELNESELSAESNTSSWNKKDIEPIYRAATDKEGKFTGEMNIPASISKVWLASDYLGTASPVELTIGEDRQITFNQDAFIQALRSKTRATRGITGNQHNFLTDWYTLPDADWDDNGRPNNLSKEINMPPADILYYIKHVFRKSSIKDESGKSKLVTITTNYPQFFDIQKPISSDIPIVKPTEVSLVFVNSSATWYNTVGYYTYPTGTHPTEASIRKTIVFPNVSPIYKSSGSGALVCGEEVKLKYWNEEKQAYESTFPKDVTIGWCLQGMGFKNKPENMGDIIKGMGTRYSTRELNKDGKQRTVSLRDKESSKIVAIGFEDNIDLDYADALFYIHTSEENAVAPELPELPEEPEAIPSDKQIYTINYSGTLAFEDLWPKEGDYDMNDLMIKYNSTVYKMVLDNRIYQIVDTFTVQHCGGYLQNGFGYQLHNLENSNIKKVEIIGPDANNGISSSQYMEGKELEPGQSHPTILLFDDMNKYKGVKDETKKRYIVSIQLDGVNEKDIVPPYNPFIFISSNEERGKELHMVKYPPTDKVNTAFFWRGKDISRVKDELYYVSIDLMPFAMNLPIVDPAIFKEGIRIDETYPKFTEWATSNGTKNKDWYKFPKK